MYMDLFKILKLPNAKLNIKKLRCKYFVKYFLKNIIWLLKYQK